MIDPNIQVYTKETYGKARIYPHNEQALNFATLMGKKTFTLPDVVRMRSMGFEVQMVIEGIDSSQWISYI